ncbi:jg17890 [Pararge aegeria aegeria]|uniref:Jg17890 protein n=1 Tax=Pararge aegeria aegeria TaxID=348720 RepID=A0A8S4SPA2_9NEOP|nr:jg17890 [Pararge aegeria aegeria]
MSKLILNLKQRSEEKGKGPELVQPVDPESVMRELSHLGRFHLQVYLLIALAAVQVGLVHVTYIFLAADVPYRYRGRRKMGEHSRSLRYGSQRKKQNASYVLMVFQQRNGADSFGTSQFDGRKEMV